MAGRRVCRGLAAPVPHRLRAGDDAAVRADPGPGLREQGALRWPGLRQPGPQRARTTPSGSPVTSAIPTSSNCGSAGTSTGTCSRTCPAATTRRPSSCTAAPWSTRCSPGWRSTWRRRRRPTTGSSCCGPPCCWPWPGCCPPRCWRGWPGCGPGGSRWHRRWCCTPFTTGTCSRSCATVVAFWALLRGSRPSAAGDRAAARAARTAGLVREHRPARSVGGGGRWRWASARPSSSTR